MYDEGRWRFAVGSTGLVPSMLITGDCGPAEAWAILKDDTLFFLPLVTLCEC